MIALYEETEETLKRKENLRLISLNKVDAVVCALPERDKWLQDRFYQPNTGACRMEEKI